MSDPSTWTLPRLRIDRDGAWYHDDAEVTHAGILANLRENLRVDEQGHYLQVGPARVPVEVEDIEKRRRMPEGWSAVDQGSARER